jgi:hypothetical protein
MKPIGDVVIVKLALVLPGCTTTVWGTWATVLAALLVRFTTPSIPSRGGGAVRVTVPVTEEPLLTRMGLRLKEARNGSGGTSVTVAFWEDPP